MNRRDLLKFFGVGATVVPIIGHAPHLAAAAQLVEPAVITPVAKPILDAADVVIPALRGGYAEASVTIWVNGARHDFKMLLSSLDAKTDPIEITGYGDAYRTFMGGETTITMRGSMLAEKSKLPGVIVR